MGMTKKRLKFHQEKLQSMPGRKPVAQTPTPTKPPQVTSVPSSPIIRKTRGTRGKRGRGRVRRPDSVRERSQSTAVERTTSSLRKSKLTGSNVAPRRSTVIKVPPVDDSVIFDIYKTAINCIFVPGSPDNSYNPQTILELLKDLMGVSSDTHNEYLSQDIEICNFEVTTFILIGKYT